VITKKDLGENTKVGVKIILKIPNTGNSLWYPIIQSGRGGGRGGGGRGGGGRGRGGRGGEKRGGGGRGRGGRGGGKGGAEEEFSSLSSFIMEQ
jgi:hypothetical protein